MKCVENNEFSIKPRKSLSSGVNFEENGCCRCEKVAKGSSEENPLKVRQTNSLNFSNDSPEEKSKYPKVNIPRLIHKRKNKISSYFNDEWEDYKDEINEIREYQREIFKNCKDKNSIIFLETGTGKSLISILLIDYYLKKHRKQKKIAFLSNEVNLVEQQTNKILTLLPEIQKFLSETERDSEFFAGEEIVIETLHGDMGIDYWNGSKWKKMVYNTDVFSCTTQVYLNCLRKGYLKLYQFCLIIFDECHHTEKNHAFNNIMREFYYFYNQQNTLSGEELYKLPYIIGMTASPAKFSKVNITPDQLKEKLESLCLNLNSNFVWFNQNLVESFIKRPNILIIPFGETEIHSEFRLSSRWMENLDNLDKIKDFNAIIAPNSRFHFLQCLNEAFEKKFLLRYFIGRNYYESRSTQCRSLIDQIHKLISIKALSLIVELGASAFWFYLRDILLRLNSELARPIPKTEDRQVLIHDLSFFFQHFVSTYRQPEPHLSEKCITLIKLLIERFENPSSSEEMTAIIFVSKRLLAKYLKVLLENYASQNPMAQMKVDFIIGHHNIYLKSKTSTEEFIKKIEDFSDMSFCESDILSEVLSTQIFSREANKTPNSAPNLIDMRFKLPDQIKTIRLFRKKMINVLISTSVTEEGLDIPECNLVVSFSEPKTIKSFIQLKGRARKEKSEYIILSPESKHNEIALKIENYEQMFLMMKEISGRMAATERSSLGLSLSKPPESYFFLMIRDTDACINTNWSTDLVAYYCSFLRNDHSIRSKPIYYLIDLANLGYIYYLILPPSSKIQIVRGDLCKKKSDAKKLVAFICCKLLFEQGLIDSELRPTGFNHFGVCGKNDEEEIRDEDLEYQKILEGIVITHRKIKRNSEEICNNYYPSFNENPLAFPLLKMDFEGEKFVEAHVYEIKFSSDFHRYMPNNISPKIGLIHKDSSLHEVSFKICPEFNVMNERKVQLLCRRKVLIKETEYYDLVVQHFFLGLAINNNDVRFYEMLTGEQIKNSFVFNFKGKHSFPLKFSSSLGKQLSLFAFLTPEYGIDFNLTSKIKAYVNFMSDFYRAINENVFARPERIKIPLNNDLIRLLRENQPVDDLVLQSITNMQKYVIFDLRKLKFTDLRKLKIGKYNMMERKAFLEKKLGFALNENDHVIFCTSIYRDYMKNLRSYVFKEKERSLTYALPIELVIFPLGLKLLFWCQFLPFIWQKLQNILMINHMREKLLIPKEYCSFLCSKSAKPWTYTVPNSMVLPLWDNIHKYMMNNNKSDYFDSEKNKLDLLIALQRKNAGPLPKANKLKRQRETDEISDELLGVNPIKKLNVSYHLTSMVSQSDSLFSSKPDFLKMRIVSASSEFKSFSLNLLVSELQTAVTFRTYDPTDSYERLEFFGDSILKFLASLEVFFEYPAESEGFLSKKRSRIVSNCFLKKACIKNRIFPYVLMVGKTWIPNGLNPDFQGNLQENSEESLAGRGYVAIPNKTLADVIESLTAVYFLHDNNISAAQAFLNMVGVLKNYSLNYEVIPNDPSPILSSKTNFLIEKFSQLEEIIGYRFRSINLLIQAFTHISFRQTVNNVIYFQLNERNFFVQHENYPESDSTNVEKDFYLNVGMGEVENFNEKVDKNSNLINKLNPSEFCYDRLEFLGDSIFDFLVVKRLYNSKRDEDPNGLSLLKSAVVNNHVLALITLYYKLNRFILFENKILKAKIESLSNQVENLIENITLFYSEFECCVKVLADVFESLIGAVFIDSGLDVKKTEEVVLKLAEKFIDKFADKEFANSSPLNGLKKFCEEKKLGLPKIKQTLETGETPSKYRYVLTIKEKKIAEVVSESRKEAEEKLKAIAMKELPKIFPHIE